ncbi:unnamed protein product, partial [Meganyctiphanes norvegica]
MIVTDGALANTTITAEDLLWEPLNTGPLFTDDTCTRMQVDDSAIFKAPGQPYQAVDCSLDLASPLCEVPLLSKYTEVIVNPGDQAQLNCSFKGNYSHCVWEKDNNTIK